MKEVITDLEQLSKRCQEIDILKENKIMREIILALKEKVRSDEGTVGLSANQLGYDKRILVINFQGDVRTFINPVIVDAKGLTLSRETCLSIPGKSYIRPRNTEITVMYQTPLNKTEQRKMFGLASTVFQHYVDLLDGITLMDIGLEVDEMFDNASEQEQNEVLEAYLDSLDLTKKKLDKEIEENPQLKQQNDAIKFMEQVAKGEIEVELDELDDETSKEIEDKVGQAMLKEAEEGK